MASGPPPKDPSKRARRNADPVAPTPLTPERAKPPRLPAHLAEDPEVVRWWRTWTRSPQAEHFGSTDWQFLLETAHLVKAFYEGQLAYAGEIRLRVAKFGATPEDRLRLRMTATTGVEKPAPAPTAAAPRAGQRHRNLRLVDEEAPGAVAGA